MSEPFVPTPDASRVSGRRFVAHAVDGTLYGLLFIVAILIVGALPESALSDFLLNATLVVGLTVGQVAFYVALQRRHGRTLGKRLAGYNLKPTF